MLSKRWLVLILIGMFLIPVNIYVVPDASADPPGITLSDWSYFKTISISNTYIDAGLKNFPILVNSTDTAMIAKCQSSGEDIRFVNTANDTAFAYEIDEWTASGFSIWVNISETIPSDTDYVFIMYYGNAGASDDQNPTGVWDENYLMVHHMTGANAAAVDDSTSNNNDVGSSGGDPSFNQDGKMGKCVKYDGNGDYLKSALTIPAETSHTGTAWIYISVDEADRMMIFEADTDYAISLGWRGDLAGDYMQAYTDTASGSGRADGSSDIPSGGWYFVATRVDAGADTIDIFVDDTKEATNTATFSGEGDLMAINGINIGTYRDEASNARMMNGYIDELQVSNIARNNSWMKATYHTQALTGGFMTLGSEQFNNRSPVFSNIDPADEATGEGLFLLVNITIEDPDGDGFGYKWGCSDGSYNSAVGNSNGTKYLMGGVLNCGTLYTWWINATDSNGNYRNETRSFTTLACSDEVAPTQNNNDTGNLTITWNVTIGDDSGSFNWSIECNGQSASADGAVNGSKSIVLNNLLENVSYTVFVNVSDVSGNWCNETYTFIVGNTSDAGSGSDVYIMLDSGGYDFGMALVFGFLFFVVGIVIPFRIRRRRNEF